MANEGSRSLVLAVRNGQLSFSSGPAGGGGPTEVVVSVRRSLISSGTERGANQLASSSLVSKARARPDLVREVISRARREGVMSTIDAVSSRLDEAMPVGYSGAGVVTSVGTSVDGLRPGDRVATAGVGHAESQVVPATLCARLPASVSDDEGAFGAVASVALHGLRLAEVGPGSTVAVMGLGLIGQIAVRLALASGCDVAGTDLDESKLALASASGATVFAATGDGGVIMDRSGGRGADAVLVTAATKSSDPMNMAARIARDRATIVAVGDVGLDMERRPLYDKELTIKVSRSYGPGRYDPVYEDLGIDYPIGYVRWPIGRNLEAVLGLIASGRLVVKDLITHRFPFDEAVSAYDVFDSGEPYVGILLEYGDGEPSSGPVRLSRSIQRSGTPRLASGLVGAGRFASDMLVPSATAAGFGPWTRIASAGGTSAVRVGERHGFEEAVSDADAVIDAGDTEVVFIASRHDGHADITARALSAGRHVFCEKPLAISDDELATVADAVAESNRVLMVGFNRRWSPVLGKAVSFVGRGSPLHVNYRVHAGALPDDHWLKDRRQGGRLLGEGCHFIDTANAITDELPKRVYAMSSGVGELLLHEDFTITLDYPSGSQAVISYSSGSPKGAGKERIEITRGDRSADILDFRRLTLRSATKAETVKYKPADKGHGAEFVVFREAIEGKRDANELANSAIATTHIALRAVESLMTGQAIDLVWD